MATRDVGDITTDPGGKSGQDWTTDARESIQALWDLHLGTLQSVAGTNTLTAAPSITDGFTALADGMTAFLVAVATNTGAMTLNISGLGAKSLRSSAGVALAAGDVVNGSVYLIGFLSTVDEWRIISAPGVTNNTLEGGLMLKRSSPNRLAATTSSVTALTPLTSIDFACSQTDSRVIIEGSVSRLSTAGTSDNDGLTCRLYVDNVATDSFTDHVQSEDHASTDVYFSYSPGNTDTHTYEIRCESTLAQTYMASGTYQICSEVAPNP